MEKSNKELAVELVSAYLSAWFSRETTQVALKGDILEVMLKDALAAVQSLDEGT